MFIASTRSAPTALCRKVLGHGQMMCSSYKIGFTEVDNKCAAKFESLIVLRYMQLLGNQRDLPHA